MHLRTAVGPPVPWGGGGERASERAREREKKNRKKNQKGVRKVESSLLL